MSDGQQQNSGIGRSSLALWLGVRTPELDDSRFTSGRSSSSSDGEDKPVCPWDFQPVVKWGETCDLGCYRSWWYWHASLTNGENDAIVKLESDELVPLTLSEQPWYERYL